MKTIKKLVSAILCLLIVFSFTSVVASADSSVYLTFSKSGEAYTVDKCSASASGVISIPETYNGLPVKKIADNAFEECSSITQVVIPKSIEKLGKFAFAACGSLKYISFNNTNCEIGASAFSGCDSLETVSLPSNLAGISKEMFKSCRSLSEIYLPSTVMAIGEEAFMNSGLTKVTIPAAVMFIGKNAYMSCAKIEKFTVEAANKYYKSIDDCLYNADGTALIQYAAGKTETSYTVPDKVVTIGDGAFSTSSNLKKIVLPSTLTSIEAYAFFDCAALSEINIPEGVTSIGSMAFNACSSLKSITVPSTVNYFGNAFLGSGLESVVLANGLKKISSKAFANCKNLKSVTIPSSITSIEIGAFDGCTSLGSLVVPATVTSIGNGAFVNCPKINLIVEKDSQAHKYAVENSLPYTIKTEEKPAVKTLSKISIKTMPQKLTYTVGQKLDTTGLILKLDYSDGTTAEISNGFTASADLSTAGKKTVTVAYGGKTASYTVTVNPKADAAVKTAVSIAVAKLPNKTEYIYKEAVDITGLVIRVNYSDGSNEEITSGFITDAPSQIKNVGESVVNVTYGDLKTSFTVTASYAWWQWIIRILLLGFLWY